MSIAHFAGFGAFERPLVTDVRYYAYFAWRVAEGEVPHRDFYSVKTQLSVFAGALLHRLGEAAGVDPLYAVRVGYLGLAALGGLLAFAVQRRLGGGAAVAGFLGLLAYCAFGLLGALPAVGNVPKLGAMLLGSTTALLACERRWRLAGAAGALAGMDWQIGAFAFAAALAAAAGFGRPRAAALRRVCLGGAAALAPFALYYAWHGALGAALEQTLLETLGRGSSVVQATSLTQRLNRVLWLAERTGAARAWLFHASWLGAAVALAWLWRRRGSDAQRLLLPLCVFHFGMAGFCLIDFQWYGDFFALLHSAAFFLGLLGVALYAAIAERLPALVPRAPAARVRAAGATALLLGAVALARPGPLRPELPLVARGIRAGATLADQREVASAVALATIDRRLAALGSTELLVLLRRPNLLPLAYYNATVWRHFRTSAEERPWQTASRLLREADPDAFLVPAGVELDPDLAAAFEPTRLASRSGRYSVVLHRRRAAR